MLSFFVNFLLKPDVTSVAPLPRILKWPLFLSLFDPLYPFDYILLADVTPYHVLYFKNQQQVLMF